jgi:nitrite reductase (NO-forming)
MVEFVVDVPGDYPVVDHSIFRASSRGTVGLLSVAGRENPLIFSGRTRHDRYEPGTRLAKSAAFTEKEVDEGAAVYERVCATCHQADGAGVPSVFPPLASSDFFLADTDRAIRIAMKGLKGRISVNGAIYSGEMPNPKLDDEQIAGVLTHIAGRLNGSDVVFNRDDVARIRRESPDASPLVAEPSWALPAKSSQRETP